jgi:hypothetical protein
MLVSRSVVSSSSPFRLSLRANVFFLLSRTGYNHHDFDFDFDFDRDRFHRGRYGAFSSSLPTPCRHQPSVALLLLLYVFADQC